METREILEELDREIARLQQVRAVFSGGSGSVPSPKRGRGGKRILSAEARAKIAVAQKKR